MLRLNGREGWSRNPAASLHPSTTTGAVKSRRCGVSASVISWWPLGTASVRGGDPGIAQNQVEKVRAGFQTNGLFGESAEPMASESVGRPQARLVPPSIGR